MKQPTPLEAGSMSDLYDTEFFEAQRPGAKRSAEIIVPIVMDLVKPSSVVDVGCGTGEWLATFAELGLTDLLGLDGEYMNPADLAIPRDRFQAMDLAAPFDLGRQFDLAVCLELAEHLPEESAVGLIESLTGTSPVVLFSAAIPLQGGTGHVNEQWPEYWAEIFLECEFIPIDAIRPLVWHNQEVDFWYAQNALFYAREDTLETRPKLKRLWKSRKKLPLSLVHPSSFVNVSEKLSAALDAYEYYAEASRKEEEESTHLRAELDSFRSDSEQARTNLETLRERLQSETWRLEDEIDAAREWAMQRGRKLELLDKSLEEAEAAIGDLTAKLSDQTSVAERARTEAKEAQEKAQKATKTVAELTAKLSDQTAVAKKATETVTELTARLAEQTSIIERMESKAEQMRGEISAANTSIEELGAELAHFKFLSDPRNMSPKSLITAFPRALSGLVSRRLGRTRNGT